jgi:NAD(P)H-hydrate epimerase
MGNNGGDGLAIARHLHNRGYRIHIDCTNPTKFTGDALINWRIVSAMKLPWDAYNKTFEKIPKPALIIDAIFGTGLSEPPRAPFDQIVEQIHRTGSPILAIDLPSGLDCDTGRPLGAYIRATRTVTFVARKIGFENPESKHFTGEITVANIGCPREAIEEAIRLHP